MTDHRDTIRAFYDDVWNREDTSRIPDLMHADVTFRGSLGDAKHGHAGFAEYVADVHAALGEYRCDIEETILEGDKAFARMRFSGVHRGEFLGFAPSGEHLAWAGAAVFTFRDGRIADLWVLGDVHALVRELARHAEEGGAGADEEEV